MSAPHPARAGLSLLEMMIVLLVGTVLAGLSAQAIGSGTRLSDRLTVQIDLTNRANRVLNDLALELRSANADPAELFLPVAAGGDPDCAADTAVYRYRTAIGISPATDVIDGTAHDSFHTRYEPGYRKVVYDRTAGTLTRKVVDSLGGVSESRTLCDGLPGPGAGRPDGGFVIRKIGNTLSMQLTLQATLRAGTADEETVVRVSQAQVLFLRSTLNSYTGSCPYTDYAEGAPSGSGLTTTGPQIFFSNALNYTASVSPGSFGTTESQVVVYLQPPVGRSLDTASIVLTVSTDYQTGTTGSPPSAVFATGTQVLEPGKPASFAYGGTSHYTGLLRTDSTADSGCHTILLQGVIAQPITVTVSAATAGGATATSSKLY